MKRYLYLALPLVALLSFFYFSGTSEAEKSEKPAVPESSASLYKKPSTPRTYWPTKGWKVKDPAEAGMDSEKLKLMEDYAFTRSGPESERAGIRTDGVVIIKNGYLVYEKYAGSFGPDDLHITWSDSKSFTNAIYGIAVMEGKVAVDDPAYEYYPSLKREGHEKITVHHLLQMSSGLYANETYEASPLESTVNAMLFTTGHRDMAEYAASQELEAAPGTHWEYSSPAVNLLMAMLKKTMTPQEYDEYPWKKLFGPLGMQKTVWERDAAGTFVGSSYVFARPRDMAKFGFLFLNDGIWEGKRLLPEGWVHYSTTIASAFYTTELTEEDRNSMTYGALWWLNRDIPEINFTRQCPDAPADMFAALGHWGQFIFVIPSLDMVVVYVGDNRDHTFDRNHFLKLIIDSIVEDAK